MAYCTVDEIKTHAGISSSDYDSVLTLCITYAQAYIEDETGKIFECSSDQVSTRYLDTPIDVYLYLDDDLCEIITITNGDGVAVESSDYVTRPKNETPFTYIKLKGSTSMSWENDSDGDVEDAIAVNGKWAYSATVPSIIKYATIRLALHIFSTRTNDTDADRIIMLENGTYLMPAGIPRDVATIISQYHTDIFEVV